MLKFMKNKSSKQNNLPEKYKKDINIVKDYYDTPYPRRLHDVGLYYSVDYMAGLCNSFIYNFGKDLTGHLDVFRGDNLEDIEHKIMLYNLDDLNNYYIKMRTSLRILQKYYNEDGTLKDKYK